MWLSSTVSTDFFPKRKKNLLLQQAMELILRMVAKLAISGLVSRSLGGKSFCLQETWENCHKHLECHLKTDPNCELGSQTMACSQWASCPCGCGPYNTSIWPAQVHTEWCWCQACSVGVCLTLWGDLLPHCAQQSGQAKITNFHPCQASNNS